MFSIILAVFACASILWQMRRDPVTLGLPVAYLFSLLFQHVPGAVVNVLSADLVYGVEETAVGMRLTAIGVVCFAVGVITSRRLAPRYGEFKGKILSLDEDIKLLAKFTLVTGWIFLALGLTLFEEIASIGAAADMTGTVWIVGVILGLSAGLSNNKYLSVVSWIFLLSLFPLYALIGTGFISSGGTSVFYAITICSIVVRNKYISFGGLVAFFVASVLIFTSYFSVRDEIRLAAWAGGPWSQRIEATSRVVFGLEGFDQSNVDQVKAIDDRLNQNLFVGLAVRNINEGNVELTHGRSFTDGILALVPRIIWPSKPVFAGSSEVITHFTGFDVAEGTTYGVGQVLDFYVNFGVISLIMGFTLFGLAIGYLDVRAADCIDKGFYGRSILYFMPALAMNAPLSSTSEVMGNMAAALVGALVLRQIWVEYSRRRAGWLREA